MKNNRTPPSKLSKLLVYQVIWTDCKFPSREQLRAFSTRTETAEFVSSLLVDEDITITVETLVEYTGKGGEDD